MKKLNNLATNLLKIDDSLIVPNSNDTYIVKNGDTLYSIARENNISVDKLKEINNLTSDIIRVGQELKFVDSNINDIKKYIVKAGDTLYSIANRFNTTVDIIKKLNKLNSNLLSVGSELILP